MHENLIEHIRHILRKPLRAPHSASLQQSNKTSRQNDTSLLPGDGATQSHPHGGHGFRLDKQSSLLRGNEVSHAYPAGFYLQGF